MLCTKCRRPIDEESVRVFHKMLQAAKQPLRAPKVCAVCIWMALRGMEDDDGKNSDVEGPGGHGGTDRLRRVRLGDGDYSDIVGVAVVRLTGFGDSTADLDQIGGNCLFHRTAASIARSGPDFKRKRRGWLCARPRVCIHVRGRCPHLPGDSGCPIRLRVGLRLALVAYGLLWVLIESSNSEHARKYHVLSRREVQHGC